MRDFSEHTVRNRESHIKFFLAWCAERGLTEPTEITRPVLERFQRHMFHYRKRDGEPMSFRSQHVRLVALRCGFAGSRGRISSCTTRHRRSNCRAWVAACPKHVLTISEVEQVLQQPNISDPLGLRDRAILEVLYSCGIRRAEVIHLKLYDLDPERGTLLVRQGKGKKIASCPSASVRSLGCKNISAKRDRSL